VVAAEARETLWSRMTLHNFTIGCLHALSAARMVQLSYIPTRVVDEAVLQSASDSLAFYQS
jgi:hypothetical protein